MATWADFDDYLAEHGIPEEDVPGAFALWLGSQMDGRVPRFEKVERGAGLGPVIDVDDLGPPGSQEPKSGY
jgi:hypothetical protein